MIRAGAGERIVTDAEYGTAVFFIEVGEADVLSDGGEPVRRLGRGDMFGEMPSS